MCCCACNVPSHAAACACVVWHSAQCRLHSAHSNLTISAGYAGFASSARKPDVRPPGLQAAATSAAQVWLPLNALNGRMPARPDVPGRASEGPFHTGTLSVAPGAAASTIPFRAQINGAPVAVQPAGRGPVPAVRPLMPPSHMPNTAQALVGLSASQIVSAPRAARPGSAPPPPLPVLRVLTQAPPVVLGVRPVAEMSAAARDLVAASQVAARVHAAAAALAVAVPRQGSSAVPAATPQLAMRLPVHGVVPAAPHAPVAFASAAASPGLPPLAHTAAPLAAALQPSSQTQLPSRHPRPEPAFTPGAAKDSHRPRGTEPPLDGPVPSHGDPAEAPPASNRASSGHLMSGDLAHAGSFLTGNQHSTELDVNFCEDPAWLTSPTFSLPSLGTVPGLARPASAALPAGTEEDNGTEAVSTLAASSGTPAPRAATQAAPAQPDQTKSPADEQPAEAVEEEQCIASSAQAVTPAPPQPPAEPPVAPTARHSSPRPSPQPSAPAPAAPQIKTMKADPSTRQSQLQPVPVHVVEALAPFFPVQGPGRGGRRRVRPALNIGAPAQLAQAPPDGAPVARRRSTSLVELTRATEAHRAAAAAAAVPTGDTSETVTASPFKAEPGQDVREVSSQAQDHPLVAATVRRKRAVSGPAQAPIVRANCRGGLSSGARSIFMPFGPLAEGTRVVYYDHRKDRELLEGTVKLATLRNGQAVQAGGILCAHCNEVCSYSSMHCSPQRRTRASAASGLLALVSGTIQFFPVRTLTCVSGRDRIQSSSNPITMHGWQSCGQEPSRLHGEALSATMTTRRSPSFSRAVSTYLHH